MIPTSLDRSYRFRANIRPVKFAYFVPDNDIVSLIRVLRFVPTQWGGIRNLIIPVKPDLTVAAMFDHFLLLHEPDEFVEYLMNWKSGDYEQHDKLALYLSRLFPHRLINLQHGEVHEQYDHSSHSLSVINDDDLRANLLIAPEINFNGLPEYIGLALYGAIFPGQQKLYSDFVKLETKKVDPASREFWKSQFETDPFSSVLNLTSYLITPYATVNSTVSNHFDVMFVNSITSLCMYWNCRLLRESVQFPNDNIGRRTFLLPAELLHNRNAIESLIEVIRECFPHPLRSANKHILFYQWDDQDVDQLKSVLSTFETLEFNDSEFSIKRARQGEQPLEADDLTGKKLLYSFGWLMYTDLYHEGIGPELPLITSIQFPVTLNYKNNEVQFNPPPRYINRFNGSIALDLECDVWKRYPRGHWVAQAIRQSSWFSRYGLSMTTYIPNRTTYVNFVLPSEWESLCLFFDGKGYKIKLSDKGKYANAVIHLLGQLENIEILASKQAYILLDMLAFKSTEKLAQKIVERLGLENEKASEIKGYFNEMEIAPELKGIPKSYAQLKSEQKLQPYRKTLLELLGRLSESQIIRRGFYLYCPNCGAPDWYSLLSISERLLCSGCSNEFPLPVSRDTDTEIQWQYRLNTLVNRAVDQDVLPNILSLYYATKNLSTSCMTVGLELWKGDRSDREFDFFFVSDQQIYGGECKAGAKLGGKDIASALLAAELGFTKFYFCTLQDFNQDSLLQINNLKDEIESKSLKTEIEILNGRNLLGEPL